MKRSVSGIAAWSALTPMQHSPSWEIIVTITAEPGAGPNGYMRVIRAPAMYAGRASPGMFDACRSMLDVTRSVMRVSTGLGIRDSTGESIAMKSSAGSSRASSTRSRIRRMRSRGSAVPIGPAMRAPAKRLPPSGSSARRRLTGNAIGSTSGVAPWRSW